MRISRRTSQTSAASRSAARRTAAAASALALAALTVSACASSGSGGTAAKTSPTVDVGANMNDIQILNSLQLTKDELDTAFATDSNFGPVTDAERTRLAAMIAQAKACTSGLINTSDKVVELQPVDGFFKATKSVDGDLPAAPATTTSPKPKTPSSSPSTAGGNLNDGNPATWVGTTAIVYKTVDAAHNAVKHMGTLDSAATTCGDPSANTKTTPYIFGGIGEVETRWYFSTGVFLLVDTKTNSSLAVVAQQRGRYVVVTYTRGGAKPGPGYYDLESGTDTVRAANAGTAVLGQLTAAVVGG